MVCGVSNLVYLGGVIIILCHLDYTYNSEFLVPTCLSSKKGGYC
jgi:hypothetical protein